jgi:hypothetical protein
MGVIISRNFTSARLIQKIRAKNIFDMTAVVISLLLRFSPNYGNNTQKLRPSDVLGNLPEHQQDQIM